MKSCAAAAACRHCCSFLLSLQNAPDLGEATSLVDMAPTRTLYYYVLLQQSLSLPAATSISYAKARPYTSIIATFKMNESLADFQLYVIFQKTQSLMQVGI